MIKKECNLILERLIKDKQNILIVGGYNVKPHKIITSITSLFSETERIKLFEDRREITLISGYPLPITCPSNNDNDLIRTTKEGLSINSDRIVFSIGKYTMKNLMPEILELIGTSKGNIILLCKNSNFLRNIEKELSYFVLDSQDTHGYLKKIDSIIKLNFHYKIGGYISEIWERRGNWDEIFRYHHEEIN